MTIPNSVQLEDVPCPLCNDRNDKIILRGHDLLYGLPGEFTIVQCLDCGLMRTNPRPTMETMGFYYPDDYGPYISTIITDQNKRHKSGGVLDTLKKIIKPIYRKIVQFNTTCLPTMAPGRMLEPGCASGSFLHQMAQKGWDVYGIEYSEKAASAARQAGYNVHIGPLETAPDYHEPFDLIVGWMVLEHLQNPIRSLRKLRAWAWSDTWLVLSVPNAGSIEFSMFKHNWYALHLPAHLYHFTPETITKVLAQGGWRVERIFHQRSLSNLVASFGYVLQDWGFNNLGRKLSDFPEKAGRYSHLGLYPFAWLLSQFGQTGRMTVWARKTQ
ncbi:methionine biosynthesis protein MetW [delta proteobacterium NaphS2]|nr:methionine biosynthesis protein MetW [delta proteobacterium NaphS2]